jgi:hypothetical protein
VDQVDPDVAGERFGRSLGRGRLREDFHGLFPAVVLGLPLNDLPKLPHRFGHDRHRFVI